MGGESGEPSALHRYLYGGTTTTMASGSSQSHRQLGSHRSQSPSRKQQQQQHHHHHHHPSPNHPPRAVVASSATVASGGGSRSPVAPRMAIIRGLVARSASSAMDAMGTAAATGTNDGGNGRLAAAVPQPRLLAAPPRRVGGVRGRTSGRRSCPRGAGPAAGHLFAGLDRPAAAAAATTLALVPHSSTRSVSQRSCSRARAAAAGAAAWRWVDKPLVLVLLRRPQRAERHLGLLASMRERAATRPSGTTPSPGDVARRVAGAGEAARAARHFDAGASSASSRWGTTSRSTSSCPSARAVGAAAEGGIGVGGIGVGGIGIGGGGGGGELGRRIAAFESMTSVDSSEGATVAALESMSSEGGADPEALVLEVAATAQLDFRAEAEIELSFGKGEVLLVMDVPAPDGWLMARNFKGEQGLVPEGFLRKAPLEELVAAPPPPRPRPRPQQQQQRRRPLAQAASRPRLSGRPSG